PLRETPVYRALLSLGPAAVEALLREAHVRGSLASTAALGALLATQGDYLENASVVTMMWLYPVRLDALAAISAAFTAVKFIASIGSLALIGVGLAIWGSKRLAATSTKGRAAS
ncbi:MAG: hypothetical protein ACFB51_15075, partial [Anaerolineae bacterium]